MRFFALGVSLSLVPMKVFSIGNMLLLNFFLHALLCACGVMKWSRGAMKFFMCCVEASACTQLRLPCAAFDDARGAYAQATGAMKYFYVRL